ncbi:hypothetical protein BBJ28_00010378 [Nothophytophthora sp. Chile5]|nr:hypothetical protein BBJ28_00010378 [Nothophytophthora sp. Chile5]
MSRMVDPTTKDLLERLSRASFTHHEHELEREITLEPKPWAPTDGNALAGGTYDVYVSPGDVALLQPEPGTGSDSKKVTVNIWDRRWWGLVLHNAVVGVVSTVLPLCVYPFLTCNLNMEGTQTLSARTLLGLPWVLKPLFKVLIDCSPLPCGLRLRVAMMLGWMVASAALISIYFQDQPVPYFEDRAMIGTPLDELSVQELTKINLDAPAHGAFYVMLMTVASVGYVLADVAADELIRDVASIHFHVEAPRDADEVFLPVVTRYRTVAIIACFPFMGVAMSGWDYGGDFDFTLEYTQVMLLVGLVAALPVLLLSFTVSERPRERRSLRESLREIWSLFHSRALNHLLLCRFVGGVFAGVSATAVNPVAFYYAGVQPLNDTVVSFVSILVVLLAINWVSKKGWDVDYRRVILVGTVVVLLLDCGATLFTIWDVVRSQWLWIGLPVMEAIPSVLDYTIFTTVLTEVADPAAQDVMGSLVTGVSFLAGPLGLALSKYVDALFDVTNQDIMADTTHVREHIMTTFLFAYAMQLVALLWVLALPRHASEARDWKNRSGTSTSRAVALLLLLGVSLPFVVGVHVLSVYEPTACLGVSGGVGC